MVQTWSSIKPKRGHEPTGTRGAFQCLAESTACSPLHQTPTLLSSLLQPRATAVGGERGSLTLVAVRKEVGAGFQVLPVKAVNRDGWILLHLSLEGAHSAEEG